MIITKNDTCTITCDKCGTSEWYQKDIAQSIFFKNGWGLFPNAKKYIHKCKKCQTPKSRKSMAFAYKLFGHKTM